MRFAELPSDDVIAKTAQAPTANGFNTIVVENGEPARQKVHELLTPGASVFDATSRTLDAIGLTQELHAGDIPYNAIKPQIYKKVYGFSSRVAKILMFNCDRPGRVSVILVKENLGF